jgi:hypothetical protein
MAKVSVVNFIIKSLNIVVSSKIKGRLGGIYPAN